MLGLNTKENYIREKRDFFNRLANKTVSPWNNQFLYLSKVYTRQKKQFFLLVMSLDPYGEHRSEVRFYRLSSNEHTYSIGPKEEKIIV